MKNLLITLLLLFLNVAKASDCFSLNLTQPYFLNTEKIEGFLSFKNCEESFTNPLVRLELRRKDKIYAHLLVKASNSFSPFAFDIPSDLQPDVYTLAAYHIGSRNTNITSQKILIVDFEFDANKNTSVGTDSYIITDTLSVDDPWQLHLDNSFDEGSDVSVTIASLEQLPHNKKWKKNESPRARFTYQYGHKPALYADFIEGRLLNKENNKPCKQCPIFLTIPTLRRAIYSDFTDENGNFQFKLLPFSGLEKAYFSAPELENKFKIEFREKELEIDTDYSHGQLSDFKELYPYISSYIRYRKAENYKPKEIADSIQIKQSYENILNLEAESTKIVLNEFIKVTSMREMFKEIIPHAGVKKNGTIWVYNDDFNQINPYAPVILLDGIVIDDHEFILSLNPEDLYQVSIVNRLKEMRKIGNYINRGIIAIYSRNGILTSDLPNLVSKEIEGSSELSKTSFSEFNREARFESSYSTVLKAGEQLANIDFKSYPGVFLIKMSSIDRKGFTITKEQIRIVIP